MNPDIFVVLVCIISLIIGAFIGVKCFKFYERKKNKELIENAKEVLDGSRKNIIIIDGQEYDATKFVVKDKDDNEKLIDLKGGGIVQNGRREENSTGIKEIQKQEIETPRENSKSSGKKKRNIGRISRIRRFG